jgi:hypothetical protein
MTQQDERTTREERRPPEDEPAAAQAETQTSRASRSEEDGGGEEPLFAGQDAARFRQRWEALQAGFVDEPRKMVEQADELVGDLMQQLSAGFNDKRSKLEAQWEQGDQVSTEELRVALTRYRSFFNRLLSA